VRFAQQVGFAGYPEFRQALQNQVLREIRSSERVASVLEDEETVQGPLHQILASTKRQLEHLLRNLSEDELAQITNAVINASKVLVFGEGAPAGATTQLGFWLNRLGCDVNVINQTGRRFFESIFRACENDVALVFAFRSIGPEATAIIELLHTQGGKAILFTDLPDSPIHAMTDKVVLIQRGPMDTFRPMGAVTAVVDALILSVMLARGDEAVSQLRELDDLRQRYGFL
jgi:DNA-binding MurR/RpiR family transcriptional regulator